MTGAGFDPASVLATVGIKRPVDYTIVNGRITVEKGHLLTVDEEKTAYMANKKCREYLLGKQKLSAGSGTESLSEVSKKEGCELRKFYMIGD